MKLIKLRGINCLYAFVDDEDFEKLNKIKWRPEFLKDKIYTRGYICKMQNKDLNIGMHRYIMNAYKRTEIVDHKDHNGLNNQKNNLRICTMMQNLHNRKSNNKGSVSKFIGVTNNITQWNIKKTNGKTCKVSWKATISYNNKGYSFRYI